MIISNIIGGLGNQMFQYAIGRALSLRFGVPLILDISDFARYKLHHGFELPRLFKVPMSIATPDDMKHVLGWQYNQIVKRLLVRHFFKHLRPKNFIVEPHFHHWSGINNLAASCYLYGHWQSASYFNDFENVIRSDFQFKNPLDENNKNVAGLITNSNSISLHIRRGDYVNNSQNLLRHGLCSVGYYQNAVEFILHHVVEPTIFVFSDDIDWARHNLNLSVPSYFISHNTGPNSYIDMQLMSLCRHHIIANSSFSWWGAWLASWEKQIVIAPQPWFEDAQMDTRNLTLPNWYLLPRSV